MGPECSRPCIEWSGHIRRCRRPAFFAGWWTKKTVSGLTVRSERLCVSMRRSNRGAASSQASPPGLRAWDVCETSTPRTGGKAVSPSAAAKLPYRCAQPLLRPPSPSARVRPSAVCPICLPQPGAATPLRAVFPFPAVLLISRSLLSFFTQFCPRNRCFSAFSSFALCRANSMYQYCIKNA